MRLSALEIVGFKSFADKTVLRFKPGISALVGPNGCGKSNLADAILWALGEQSPKLLRSERMEDVIFNGTETRKPLGLAEVTLTFSDLEGALPGPYSAYSEISISRCLYRNGDCDYTLNKSPARLKDIRELLIDAGAGYRAHNIIEQGKVDSLVSASPQQMRELVEEAAGIAKYRLRKAEALRKIDATEQNLARVRDIITEVRRQIQSLDRQARKAEKYKRMREELKGLELQAAHAEWTQWSHTLAGLLREEAALQEEAASQETERVGLDTRQAEGRLYLAQKEQDLGRIQNQIFEVETAIQHQTGKIETIRAQQQQWRETDTRTAREIGEIQEQQTRLTSEEASLQRQQEEIEQTLPDQETRQAAQQGQIAGLERDLTQKGSDLEQERRRSFEHAGRLSQAKNNLTHIGARQTDLQRRKERGVLERAEIDRKKVAARTEHTVLAGRLIETRQRHTEHLTEQTALSAHLADLETTVKNEENHLSELKQEWAKASALLSSREGFYRTPAEGGMPRNAGNTPNISQPQSDVGEMRAPVSVADVLDVPAAYEMAIESVLEGRLRGRVADDHAQIAPWAASLSRAQNGRGIFVLRAPRISPQSSAAFHEEIAHAEGVVGRAVDVISFHPDYTAAVRSLLGDVVIVSDFNAARRLWEKNESAWTWVTLQGEVMAASGTVAAGRPGEAGLLELKREIRILTQQCARIKGEMAALEARIVASCAARQQAQSKITALAQTVRALEIQQVSQQKDLAALASECERLEKAAELLAVEQTQWETEAQEMLAARAREEEIAAQQQALAAQAEAAVGVRQAALVAARAHLDAAREEGVQLKLSVSSLKEKQGYLQEQRAGIARTRMALEERLVEKKRLRVSLREQDQAGDAESQTLSEKIARAATQREQYVAQKQGVALEHAALRQAFAEMETTMAALRVAMVRTQKRLQEKAVARVEADLTRQKTREAILTHYQIDLALHSPVDSHGANLTAPSDTPDTSQPQGVIGEEAQADLPPVEATTQADDVTLDAAAHTPVITPQMRERVVTLRRTLDEMGPVNMGAIEEYQELEGRHQFLTAQEGDLTASLEGLKEAITKINATTKGLFVDTFHALNAKFQEVFAAFFGGGRAELVMLDEAHPLETGLDLQVEPPGKKPRAVSLLSGGEKALTAISLLFATFLIHPGPFCLLDEIDAPLDDENTRRFTQALTRMSDRIQFIVITHNKRTMEVADVLYGVTMEEPGISKMVSVNLCGIERARTPVLAAAG